MNEFIKCELAKCLDTLAKTSPASEEYSRILGGLHNVYSLSECIEECIAFVNADAEASVATVIEFPKAETPIAEEESPFTEPEVFTPAPVETPTPSEEELTEIAELNGDGIDSDEAKWRAAAEAMSKDQFRDALVELRTQKGVDVVGIIRRYGVSNLTALPKDKYADVYVEAMKV